MSKRRRRKTAPNLPEETLARARQQAAQIDGDDQLETEPETGAEDAPVVEEKRRPRKRRRERLEPVELAKNKTNGELDSATIAELLANPTKFVTEEELRDEYTYVLQDLRGMGILAGVLFVALVLAAQFL